MLLCSLSGPEMEVQAGNGLGSELVIYIIYIIYICKWGWPLSRGGVGMAREKAGPIYKCK
jgi:hypothetical protein